MTTRTTNPAILPLIRERWSPRSFDASAMRQADLEVLLEAAGLAPSAYNIQPWTFLYAHRDDANWSYAARLGIPLQLSVLTALGDYDADVSATMVIPGSHRWPIEQPIDAAEARPVELRPGSSLVYLGSLVHGGGWNRTADRWRKALYIGFLVGWLTPEEAVARSVTPEVAARLPERARALLAWASMRGNASSSGPEAALHLWQLDAADAAATDGLFQNR